MYQQALTLHQHLHPVDPQEPTGVTLSDEEVLLGVGETEVIIATVSPDDVHDHSVTWTISDDAIATVDANGVVTALSIGKTTITATTVNGLEATCEVSVANFNLLTDSRDFINKNVAAPSATTSISSPESITLKEGNDTYLKFVKATQSNDWFRAYLIRGSSVSPNFPNVDVKPNTQYTFSVWLKGTGQHTIYAYNNWSNPNPTTMTVNLTDTWTKYVLTVNTGATIPTQGVQFFIHSETVGSEINLKKPKVEQGSVATHWLPTKEEAMEK